MHINERDLEMIDAFASFLRSNQIVEGPTAGFVLRYRSLLSSGDPYPEITGYAATSFARLFDLTGDSTFLDNARGAADALMRFQHENGSIPTVISRTGVAEDIVHVFDLGIIARGFLDVFFRTNDTKYLEAAEKAIDFLRDFYIAASWCSVLDLNGRPKEHDFPSDFWINLKLIIPLEQLSRASGEQRLVSDAEEIYSRLIRTSGPNGFFESEDKMAYNRSHYHAYALYGIAHYFNLTKDEKCLHLLRDGIEKLSGLMSPEGGIFTNFGPHGEPIIYSGFDLPVSAQLAELLQFRMTIDGPEKEAQALVLKLEEFLFKNTHSGILNKKMSGGLPFIKKRWRPAILVAWGVEFSINYFFDKYCSGLTK